MNKYKYHAPWDKLKTVLLGSFYDVKFFSTIKNDFIRSSLSKIAEETNEDLANFEKILKDFGCEVLRPNLNNDDHIDRYINNGEVNYINPFGRIRTVPRPPLQPRDCSLVVDNKLYITHGDHTAIFDCLDDYNKDDQIILDFELDNLDQEQKNKLHRLYYHVRKTKKWPNFENIFKCDISNLDTITQMEIEYFRKYSRQSMVHLLKAPCMTLIGKDMFVEGALFDIHNLYNYFDLRFNLINEGGHSDGCFAPINPGVLMTVKDPSLYSRTFPGWDILHLPGHAKSGKFISNIHSWKNKIGGRWYIDGKINDELINFVDNYLSDFTGFTIETVFDVNCLMLDKNHICVSNLIPEAKEFFKKHKIEPIVVPFRHRHFHDGGLHCITLDLYREGNKIDYFPEKNTNGTINNIEDGLKSKKSKRGFSWNLRIG